MCKKWRLALDLFVLYCLSNLTFELAGETSAEPPLITREELQKEFGHDLSAVFYWAFERAVEWQKKGKTEAARGLYNELLKNIQKDESLYKRVSPFIQDNLDLLS